MCYKTHLMDSDQILKIRHRLNETQVEFGKRFGVSQITIGYWESGRSRPGKKRALQLDELAQQNPSRQGEMHSFRPIQYLGSKQKLTETISNIVDEITSPQGRVCDLFSGSGVVGYRLGTKRLITAVDIQQYACVLSKAFLHGHSKTFSLLTKANFIEKIDGLIELISTLIKPLLEYEKEALALAQKDEPQCLADIIEYGSLKALEQHRTKEHPTKLLKLQRSAINALDQSKFSREDLTATVNYGGAYFSYAQAICLDAIAIAIKDEKDKALSTCGMGVLLSVASEIVNTVGKQFAQPMKLVKADGSIPKILLQRAIKDRSLNALEIFLLWVERWKFNAPLGNNQHQIVCTDVFNYLSKHDDCETFYADPPYTIDHYSRFYHVLETLVRRDRPLLDSMKKAGESKVMRGLYRVGRHQSPFGVPSEAEAAFSNLFKEISSKKANLVLSYSPFDETTGSRPRLLSLNKLIDLAKKYFVKVEILEISEHSHRKLNKKSVNNSIRTDAERLLICRM